MDTQSFHPGEQALQARVGLRERLAELGPLVMRDRMPDQHREFFAGLPTLLLGVQDATGQPWATLLHGAPGFIESPDDRTLEVRVWPHPDDPVARWLTAGASVGLLGLEPQTRRRNRANGRIRALRPDGFVVEVSQSFGNCPKYILARRPSLHPARFAAPAIALGPALHEASLALLERADTIFVASASAAVPGGSAAEGLDMSHRGGPSGFMRVEADASGVRLTLPDYRGNFYFNTLGNLMLWPRAGLLVPDYEDGSLLHLGVLASIEHEGPRLAQFPGAQRLVNLSVTGGWWRPGALPLRWSAPVAPPQFRDL